MEIQVEGGNPYTLLDGTVGFDVDDISDLVGFHVRSQSDHTLSEPSVLSPISFNPKARRFCAPSCDDHG